MKIILTFLAIACSLSLNGQDTVRIMHYNLLNYGNSYGDCNSSNNNVDDKNTSLKIITAHLQPDILTVNEIGDDPYYHNYLLDHALNVDGITQFKKCQLPNLANSPIMNQLYYNSGLFTVTGILTVETNYRDIDIVTLYYDPSGSDSVLLNCVVAHLKAGSDPDDAQERASETYKLMNYLDAHGLDGNFLLSGDLNLYSGSESAFQNLLLFPNQGIRFFDPVSKVGEWHANQFFSDIHTQSTHTSGDCFSVGGMDDRFDFILASEEIISGAEGMKYLPSSYSTIGQDGLRFDQSLVNPANSSVPEDVLNALYALSDHLPVIIDLKAGEQLGTDDDQNNTIRLSYINPVAGPFYLSYSCSGDSETSVRLLDLCGRVRWSARMIPGNDQKIRVNTEGLSPGLYLFHVNAPEGDLLVRKLIITR